MLSISVIVVTLRVMCLFSLGDIKIYALVLVEFSSSLKMWKSPLVSLHSVADAVRAFPTTARLLLDLHICA